MTSTKEKKPPAKGYANHKEGSRKATVHEVFDKQGAEAAFTRGLKLKLATSTLHSWIATWRRQAEPRTKKPVAKKTAKPATTKPVTPPDQPETIPVFLNG